MDSQQEQTILVHDGNGKNPTVLNKAQYDELCASGMMWEFHPDAPRYWPFSDEVISSIASPTPDAIATPRTDALIFAPNGNYFSASTADYRDLCRTLERELTAAKAEIAKYKELADFAETQRINLDADNTQLRAEVERLKEYAFGMETALRGARASGTASETALWKAECAELRLVNSQLRARVGELEKERTEYSIIYRRDYGHDWSTRGNYKGF